MKVVINRYHETNNQTLGVLSIFNGHKHLYSCYTLELPWKNNERKVSCIPNGKYRIIKRYSEKHRTHFHITEVENRDFILIHSGNFHFEIEGCILVGKMQSDINSDGEIDVAYSRGCMESLLFYLPDEATLLLTETL